MGGVMSGCMSGRVMRWYMRVCVGEGVYERV